MKSLRNHSIKGLLLVLSSTIFVVVLVTMLLTGIIAIILIQSGIAARLTDFGIYGAIALLALFATLFATSMTILLGRIPLRPFNEIARGMDELSRGNYAVRTDLRWPHFMRRISESFNLMAEELGSTEMLRSDFVNNFSHEFKTPIVSIRGYARLLKSSEITEAEREEYLDIIIRESTRLSELATNVLNLSKIENRTGLTNKTRYNVSEQIRRAVLLLEPKWSKQGLDMDVELDECTFFGSAELMNNVWINLIDNAIKFSPAGGQIEIRLTERGDNLVFRISDHGCGMDEETQKHIFDRFYQGDTSHAAEGNGVGLAVVSKVVSLSGGKVYVRSEPGKGAEFSVILPIEQ